MQKWINNMSVGGDMRWLLYSDCSLRREAVTMTRILKHFFYSAIHSLFYIFDKTNIEGGAELIMNREKGDKHSWWTYIKSRFFFRCSFVYNYPWQWLYPNYHCTAAKSLEGFANEKKLMCKWSGMPPKTILVNISVMPFNISVFIKYSKMEYTLARKRKVQTMVLFWCGKLFFAPWKYMYYCHSNR